MGTLPSVALGYEVIGGFVIPARACAERSRSKQESPSCRARFLLPVIFSKF